MTMTITLNLEAADDQLDDWSMKGPGSVLTVAPAASGALLALISAFVREGTVRGQHDTASMAVAMFASLPATVRVMLEPAVAALLMP